MEVIIPRFPRLVIPRDSSTISQPWISRALIAAASTDPGVILDRESHLLSGKRYVPDDVCRIPFPGIRNARACAVVVLPFAPVISIMGLGILPSRSWRTAS